MSLEKKNVDKSSISLLRDNKGKHIMNQQQIRKHVHKFYSKLYDVKVKRHDLKKYFENLQNPKLTEDLAKVCEGRLTEKECQQAVFEFEKNKTPGSDGLNIEFYQFFWTEIKVLLVCSLNEGFQKNELSNTQRQAIIKLLYKKGDKSDLENWRPISLLNYDYKIAASVLAKRLQKVISTLVSRDQVGYIKGRSLAENIRLIEDLFYYIQNYSHRGIALLSDFRKAFDCLSWDFLFECLHIFGFKKDFCKWVSTLYTNIQCCVNVNGWLTETITLSRGVRQGCPLSALLFILAVEILAIKVRSDPEIKGVEMFGTVEIKMLQFADDATIFVDEIDSLKKAIKQIETFGAFSGLELNKTKSSIVDISGNIVDKNVEGIPLSNSEVKILGVYFGGNEQTLMNKNWLPKISKIDNLIRLWKARHLTLFGKITIIKSFLVSQLIYNAQMILIPKDIMKQINSRVFQFLWNGKKDKVKRSVLCMKYESGGLKMVELNSLFQSFMLKWILHYFTHTDSKWNKIIDGFFSRIGGMQYILNCKCRRDDIMFCFKKLNMPQYYKEMIYAWLDLKEKFEFQSNSVFNFQNLDVRNEDIWFNSNVKDHKGNIIFFKKWYDAGILKISDIVKDQELMSLKEIEFLLHKKYASLFNEYHIVINAIPKVWRNRLIKQPINLTYSEDKSLMNTVLKSKDTKKKSKFFYTMILEQSITQPKVEDNWEIFLNTPRKIDWKGIWTFNLQAIKENKIAEFNFKFLHNLIPHRYNLYKWKLSNSPLCLFDSELHDNIHLFCKCKHTKLFWLKFNEIIREIYDVEFTFNEMFLIEGYMLKNRQFKSLNFLITYAKYAIYVTFIQAENRKVVFHEFSILSIFKRLVYNRLKTENNCRNKKLCIFANTVIQDNLICFV